MDIHLPGILVNLNHVGRIDAEGQRALLPFHGTVSTISRNNLSKAARGKEPTLLWTKLFSTFLSRFFIVSKNHRVCPFAC